MTNTDPDAVFSSIRHLLYPDSFAAPKCTWIFSHRRNKRQKQSCGVIPKTCEFFIRRLEQCELSRHLSSIALACLGVNRIGTEVAIQSALRIRKWCLDTVFDPGKLVGIETWSALKAAAR
jgi:hypothetical protein